MPRKSFALRVPIVEHSNGAKATRMADYHATESADSTTRWLAGLILALRGRSTATNDARC